MMGRLTLLWALGVGLPTTPPQEPACCPETRTDTLSGQRLERFQFDRVEMAVPIKLVLYAPSAASANESAEAAFARIHQLNGIFSDYDPQSETRRLCDTAGEGKAVPVSRELWEVTNRAIELSRRSDGAFDVTVGPVVKLWRRARRQKELPDPQKLAEARQLVGYRLIRMDPTTRGIELTKRGMQLDFGGIAKGYANDQALAVLRARGITRAMIQSGGDIGLGEPPPDSPGWRVAVPSLELGSPPQMVLSLSVCSVSTSGDAWQFVEIGGRRYSHVLDPTTGVGLTDHSQVTIVAPDGITAEGLSKAVSVLGPKKGLKLVEDTPGAAAFILRAPEGNIQKHQSARWKGLGIGELGIPIPNP
jgi:thiamine biosynthesis lipoprotein